MRKIVSFFLVTIVLFLPCSCSNQTNVKRIETYYPFTCNVKINYNNDCCSAVMDMQNSANGFIKIISPQDFSGLIFNLSNSDISISFKEIAFAPSRNGNNVISVADILFYVLSSTQSLSDIKSRKNEIYCKGAFRSHDYTIFFSKDTLLPTKLQFKDIDFSAEFTDFIIKS